jgi:hypothetical protein
MTGTVSMRAALAGLTALLLVAAGASEPRAQGAQVLGRITATHQETVPVFDASRQQAGTMARAELVGREVLPPDDRGFLGVRLEGTPPRLVHVREAAVTVTRNQAVAPPGGTGCEALAGARGTGHTTSGFGKCPR